MEQQKSLLLPGQTEQAVRGIRRIDAFYNYCLKTAAWVMVFILVLIFFSLFSQSLLTLKTFGAGFFFSTEWDPAFNQFGAFAFIVGTILTTLIALIISLPFSLSIALLLGEYFQQGFFSSFLKSAIELLAGIPSVIYGFWGLFVLVPYIRNLEMFLGITPYGVGIFTSALVLAIMIIPYTASMAREVIQLVPKDLKEAAYSLGATRFEVVKNVIIPYSLSGIFSGVLLSMGRALGETMAVTMVIGNANMLPLSIFSPGNTIASVIANDFGEASQDLYVSSLITLGLILFLITLGVKLVGKYILKRMSIEKGAVNGH